MKKSKRGFTLMELMTVTAIIALTASLLLTAVTRTKHKAYGIVCLNNQRQCLVQYYIMLDGDPGGTSIFTAGDGPNFWGAKDQRCFVCPKASKLRETGPKEFGNFESAYRINNVTSSYGYNAHLVLQNENSPETAIEARIKRPIRTPFIVEAAFWYLSPSPYDLPATDMFEGTINGSFAIGGMSTACLPRHGNSPLVTPRNQPANSYLPGAVSIGFFDCHAETKKIETIWDIEWYSGWQTLPKRPGS